LVFCRPQWEVRRVQRRRRRKRSDETVVSNGHAESSGVEKGIAQRGNREHKLDSVDGGSVVKGDVVDGRKKEKDMEIEDWEYYWEPYPDKLLERIPWVMDLLINFRYPGWDCQIPPMPSLPPAIQRSLKQEVDTSSKTGRSFTGLRRFDTRRELFRYYFPIFVAGYLILDAVDVVMMKDPYFIFGPTTYALPPHLAKLPPALLVLLREAISGVAIVTSLEMVFLLPIMGVLLFPPGTFGISGEPYYFPTAWGSVTNILDKGLNGLWGSWWHQIFRFAFAAPTNYVIKKGYVKAKSQAARIVATVFAFGISGMLHMGGSYSQLPHTHIFHPVVFFSLQALGIILQSTFCSFFRPQIERMPRWVRRAGNGLYTFLWFYKTGPWLADDFARGGVWLYEPIPISPLRGLGLGGEGDGWWCWECLGIGWYKGKHWWESGVAI